MVTIHHLERSRSDRIIWLCEELGIDYDITHHQRDPATMRASTTLWAVNPLGKSPAIEHQGQVVFESGAIIEYLLSTFGPTSLSPSPDAEGYIDYLQWLHAPEATMTLPILMPMICGTMGIESELLPLFADSETQTMYRYLNSELTQRDYIAGGDFTAADIMLSYTLMMAQALATSEPEKVFFEYPALTAYLSRLRARPAYQSASAKF
tara:strand:- start:856 stop:1479 length:624 start_codon:yes stop_codon:yes gene_type:complete